MMNSSSCNETHYIIYVFAVFLLLFSPVFSLNEFREKDGASTTGYKYEKIDRPFVKSIESPDGDIIDCVLYNLQPAFDDPELREYMTMPSLPVPPKGFEDDNEDRPPKIEQLWTSTGESCPNGTIPIKRPSASDDILRSISDSKVGIVVNATRGRASSTGFVHFGPYYGAKAYLNIWQPIVGRNDASFAQVWVSSTDTIGFENSVEAGWQVSRSGSNGVPRFFSYWKGQKSGCFNLQCSGFIQTSKDISFGTAYKPISRYNKDQYYIRITIWIDRNNGHWWLKERDEIVGFWPSRLFNTLRGKAYEIEYGGEVFYEKSDIHSMTQMGSGHFPYEGFKKAAFARNLEVVDENDVLKEVEQLNAYASEPNCYGVKSGYGGTWKSYIYYGGPGYNPNCLK